MEHTVRWLRAVAGVYVEEVSCAGIEVFAMALVLTPHRILTLLRRL